MRILLCFQLKCYAVVTFSFCIKKKMKNCIPPHWLVVSKSKVGDHS